ncbi:MAG: hypothetical protein CO187_00670 [Zetaproteobacteria bacterium CG_4_9_14_3_um_filter_53_7]|nr:MAG: hypothetical protein AUJ57_04965 [Zetaproteobacteria bacterium CG1_02_53_45]PJA34015.1 MAG: hypothetical protein CO187_00670 [Zetaproteobacteria bacterium CG_4_9_14_3_um_filter_53_7]
MPFSDLFYTASVWLRWLACFALLLLSITSHLVVLNLCLIVVATLLIRGLDGHWQKLVHMLRLLRWFVFPILLLHLMFSPGQLMFPDYGLPLTWQGLQQGGWLSLHLVCIFMVAMLMFRALNNSEWNRLLLTLPFAGKHLAVYLFMLAPMRQRISHDLHILKQQWTLRRDWSKFPLLILTAFRLALTSAADQVQLLWLRWPQFLHHKPAVCSETDVAARIAINTCCLVVALMAYGMVFL